MNRVHGFAVWWRMYELWLQQSTPQIQALRCVTVVRVIECSYLCAVTTTSALVTSGSPRSGKCRTASDVRSVSVRTTGPVQACVSDTALPYVTQRDGAGRQPATHHCQQVSAPRWRGDAACPGNVLRMSSPYTPTTRESCSAIAL